MRLAPLIEAAPVVQAHVALALAALGLGAVQFALPKGDRRHRGLGRAWVLLLGLVALGSFGIHGLRQVGPFSWIHAVSAGTLVTLAVGVGLARTGRIAAHRWTMTGLYLGALVITGGFTLVPGRVMHRVLFG